MRTIGADDRNGAEMRPKRAVCRRKPRVTEEYLVCARDFLAAMVHQRVTSHGPPCVHSRVEVSAFLVPVTIAQPAVEVLVGGDGDRPPLSGFAGAG